MNLKQTRQTSDLSKCLTKLEKQDINLSRMIVGILKDKNTLRTKIAQKYSPLRDLQKKKKFQISSQAGWSSQIKPEQLNLSKQDAFDLAKQKILTQKSKYIKINHNLLPLNCPLDEHIKERVLEQKTPHINLIPNSDTSAQQDDTSIYPGRLNFHRVAQSTDKLQTLIPRNGERSNKLRSSTSSFYQKFQDKLRRSLNSQSQNQRESLLSIRLKQGLSQEPKKWTLPLPNRRYISSIENEPDLEHCERLVATFVNKSIQGEENQIQKSKIRDSIKPKTAEIPVTISSPLYSQNNQLHIKSTDLSQQKDITIEQQKENSSNYFFQLLQIKENQKLIEHFSSLIFNLQPLQDLHFSRNSQAH